MTEKTLIRAWILTLTVISVLLLIADLSFAQGISTKIINPKFKTRITLNQRTNTTILFPAQFYNVSALGIVFRDKNAKGKAIGTVEGWYTTPDHNLPILELRALSEDLDTFMTVFMDGKLYTFELVAGDTPDIALTLEKGDATQIPVVSPPAETTPETVRQFTRPSVDPQVLSTILDLVREQPLLQASYPEGYEGSSHKDVEFVSDDGFVRTTVTRIFKFSKQDAVAITGKVENLTDAPIKFGTPNVGISVGTVLRPITLLYPTHPVPANKGFEFDALIVGGRDGARDDVSLDNEFRLIVDSGHRRPPPDAPSAPKEIVPIPTPLPPSPLLPRKGDIK